MAVRRGPVVKVDHCLCFLVLSPREPSSAKAGRSQALEHFPLRIGSRHDPDAEQYAEEKLATAVGSIFLDAVPRLRGRKAARKKASMPVIARRSSPGIGVVRGNLKRRIDQETSLSLPVLKRMIDDLLEEDFERYSAGGSVRSRRRNLSRVVWSR